ncbi:unnamed protein product [Bathycoccus prasinos]
MSSVCFSLRRAAMSSSSPCSCSTIVRGVTSSSSSSSLASSSSSSSSSHRKWITTTTTKPKGKVVVVCAEESSSSGGGKSRFKRRDPDAKPPPAPLGSGPPMTSGKISEQILEKTREENPEVEVIPLQQTRFQGVANIDDESSETSQSNVLKRRAILFAGDVAAFSVFATIGRASHGEGLNPIDIVGTASPFILGWAAASYLLGTQGAFGDSSRRSGVDKLGKILPSVGKTILLGVPIGVIVRSVATFHVPDISFLFVSLGFNGVALLLWRVSLSSDIRVGGNNGDATKPRTNKKGNPLEFLSLLSGLVKRW